jgi:hypothetical protein
MQALGLSDVRIVVGSREGMHQVEAGLATRQPEARQ